MKDSLVSSKVSSDENDSYELFTLHCDVFTITRGHMRDNTINHKLTVKEELRGRAPLCCSLALILGCGLYPICVFISGVIMERKKAFFKLLI